MSKHPVLPTLFLSLIILGCSDGHNIGALIEAPPTTTVPPLPLIPPAVPPEDVAGMWFSRTETNGVNCGTGLYIDGQAINISQTDSDITLLMSTGDTFAGKVNGDILEWAGDYPERGGTTSITSLSVIVSANSASGNADWIWTNGTDSCAGTMAINASQDWGVAETDFNSRLRDADVLTFTDSVSFIRGIARSEDDKDYFSFSLTRDAMIQVELSHFDVQMSNLDLEIIDNNRNVYATSSSMDRFEKVDVQLQAGLTYYIGVLPVSLPTVTNYYLSVDVN